MLTDPRKYVRLWLTKAKVVVDERGELTSSDGRDYFQLFDAMFLDYCEQIDNFNRAADKKIRGAPESNLRKALDEIISVELIKRRAEIMNKIKYIESDAALTPLRTFIRAMTGAENEKVLAVMAHFLWTVKRRLSGKEVVFHIMPIIYGAQNAGKSLSLQRLFKPLTNLTLELHLTDVTDPRYYFSLSKSFVVILDEMAGAKKADVESLKKQITASYNDVRKLGTNTVIKVKQNASFIGTTNRAASELIFDSTGMRRFYEIRTLEKLDWDAINGIDYEALYQGINENLERGYIEPLLQEISLDQEELVTPDELTVFCESHHLEPGARELEHSEVYEAYKTWADINGVKNPLNSMWFGRKMKNKGLNTTIKRNTNKITRYYQVSEECELLKRFDPLAKKTITIGNA